MALADLLGPQGPIWSVDRDGGALEGQQRALAGRFPDRQLTYLRTDFTRPLDLSDLDGVLMANSLHYVRDKAPVLEMVRSYLRPGGRFVLVEYDVDQGNWWVPHPMSFETWKRVSAASGLVDTRLLGTVSSGVLGRIYSALSFRSTDLSNS